MRTIVITLLFLSAATVRAEGAGPQGPSDANRVRGAIALELMGRGLVSVGGRKLRYLAPGARTWKVLYEQQGHLANVGTDAARGRVLAVWESDPAIHYVSLKPARHVALTLPDLPLPEDTRFHHPYKLHFAPNGRDALVYTYGPRGRTMSQMMGRGFSVPLDGKGEASLLYDVENGVPLWTSSRGVVYLLPKTPGDNCAWRSCVPGRIVAFAVDDSVVEERVLLDRAKTSFGGASLVAGSDDDRLLLHLQSAGKQSFLEYRWKGVETTVHTVSTGRRLGTLVGWVPKSNDVIYLNDRGAAFLLTRVPLRGEATVPPEKPEPPPPTSQNPFAGLSIRSTNIHGIGSANLRVGKSAPLHTQRPPGELYGQGIRKDGTVWHHRGDRMTLIDGESRARHVDLLSIVGGRPEWAGSNFYVKKPEALWIGVEIGAGRHYVRVPFAELERRAQPDPPVEAPPDNQRVK